MKAPEYSSFDNPDCKGTPAKAIKILFFNAELI